MSSASSRSPTPAAGASHVGIPELWRGVLVGFLPLLLLAVFVVAAEALTVGARALSTGQDFSTEQLAVVLTLALGLALGLVVYVLALVRVWRRMTIWRLTGHARQAIGALWALAITALIILLPVVLALVIPQHAAP